MAPSRQLLPYRRVPLLAVPLGLAAHAVAAWMTKRDPYFFEILLRHVRQASYWD